MGVEGRMQRSEQGWLRCGLALSSRGCFSIDTPGTGSNAGPRRTGGRETGRCRRMERAGDGGRGREWNSNSHKPCWCGTSAFSTYLLQSSGPWILWILLSFTDGVKLSQTDHSWLTMPETQPSSALRFVSGLRGHDLLFELSVKAC